MREVIRNFMADFDLTMGLAGCREVAEIGLECLARWSDRARHRPGGAGRSGVRRSRRGREDHPRRQRALPGPHPYADPARVRRGRPLREPAVAERREPPRSKQARSHPPTRRDPDHPDAAPGPALPPRLGTFTPANLTIRLRRDGRVVSARPRFPAAPGPSAGPPSLEVSPYTVAEDPGYRAPTSGNLGGWYRALDLSAGPVRLHDGLLSRDGWYLLDDSHGAHPVRGASRAAAATLRCLPGRLLLRLRPRLPARPRRPAPADRTGARPPARHSASGSRATSPTASRTTRRCWPASAPSASRWMC